MLRAQAYSQYIVDIKIKLIEGFGRLCYAYRTLAQPLQMWPDSKPE